MSENKLTYLVGGGPICEEPLVPYDERIILFLNDFARELRQSRQAAEHSDIMSLAYFCRAANIRRLKQAYENSYKRIGRGVVFHITPGNVPVNFAFSFLFGLLAGNANIVRVPEKEYPHTQIICDAINRVLEDPAHGDIKKMTAFVHYLIDDEITTRFSAQCDARIIWGGDRTIAHIRGIPTRPRGVEIAFADRYSFCVMDAPSVLSASDGDIDKLALGFYNDTYLMDQNACSSPMLIVWQGDGKEKAKERFYAALFECAKQKYTLEPVFAVDKYTQLLEMAIDMPGIKNVKRYENYLYVATLSALPEKTSEVLRAKYGLFFELDEDDLGKIAPFIDRKFQTLTYFGGEKQRLQDFVLQNRLVGIDRIVPIGQALDIGVYWDGYDIVSTLSRIVDLK
ncbi:MAG: acyl-CoA reductase [Christensenellaceae bacterium]